jgi:hypothetical protein
LQYSDGRAGNHGLNKCLQLVWATDNGV